MSTAERRLQVVQSSSLSQFPPEKIELIKNTVAKGTTNDELEMFLYLAGQYGLDPFKKEIWCIKYDSKSAATIMTSRDGYLKIAQSNPDFDGVKSFVVHEGDTFEIDAMTDQITHKFGAKRGKIIGAWAIAYHKQLRPQIAFVNFDEYNQNNSIWKKYPSAMIQKVAEGFVLKRQFGINGLVTQEEMTEQQAFENDANATRRSESADKAKRDFKAQWKQRINEIWSLAKELGLDDSELREIGQALINESNPTKWTFEGMDKITEYLAESVTVKSATVDVEAQEVEQSGDTTESGELPGQTAISFDDLPF